ncbi:pathogenicity protein [Drechmeria coniospora]|uniref:Protein YOP1 n=1 Tax=Drechmeria coniospora TaxID=98403 RepID=A0A151GT50_DRECN|nr:pathogenicity protein [Drechmeria coniospora]KYK60250.1 pathogenicity protein [Drechmeria coniospora]
MPSSSPHDAVIPPRPPPPPSSRTEMEELPSLSRLVSLANPCFHPSSVASFLFPIFASYKALKTSDPAELTPWLMYWVVFSCCLLVESWVSFILAWVPFYGYMRLLFLLYLILPQTQGARIIYEERVHPFLEENEASIDDFIASAHDRLKTAGISYFRQAIEYIKTSILGLPPTEPPPEPAAAQSYTQALLARFSVPTTRWTSAASTGNDFYNLLAGAVSAATGAGRNGNDGGGGGMTDSGTLIPPNLRGSAEKMSFIAAQRERLNILLSVLDHEAQEIQRNDQSRSATAAAAATATTPGEAQDEDATQRPPSGLSVWSALSKSRSETDFEKVEAESPTEEDSTLRRRRTSGASTRSWRTWGWGGSADTSASSAQEE